MLMWRFILKHIWRDRHQTSLIWLVLALIISVAGITAIQQLSGLISASLHQQTLHLKGADSILTSSIPITPNWQKKAHRLQLSQTTTVRFLSMMTHASHMQLADVKAIDSNYPLYGHITLANNSGDKPYHLNHQAPQIGQIWASEALLKALHAHVGDTLRLGDATFKVAYVLINEPQQGVLNLLPAPVLIMNQQDVARTHLIQPGSIIYYQWLLKGSIKTRQALQQSIAAELTPRQSWRTSRDKASIVEAMVNNSLVYLKAGLFLTLLLAGLVIHMAMTGYLQQQALKVALLRSFGATHSFILRFYMGHLGMSGLGAILAGIVFGYSLQPVWVYGLKRVFDFDIAGFIWQPAVVSLLAAMGMLVICAMPYVWSLKRTDARALFFKTATSKPSFLAQTLALCFIALLAYAYMQSWPLVAGLMLMCVFYTALAWGSLNLMLWVIKHVFAWLPSYWQFGLTHIRRRLNISLLYLISLGLSLTSLIFLIMLQQTLLQHWHHYLPKQAPNFFALNIEPFQVQSLTHWLERQHVQSSFAYPIVRGRITAINGQPVSQALGEKARHISALKRELSLSWRATLPADNLITAGRWQVPGTKAWLSVAEKLAHSLHVHVGDTLSLRIANQTLTLPITSIRQVDWLNFQPNFFILLKPGALDAFPATYLLNFYLNPQQHALLAQLKNKFPNISIINIGAILSTTERMLQQASQVLTFMALLNLSLSLLAALQTMLSFAKDKQQETNLLKILGARQKQLAIVRHSEAALLGFISGLLAVGCALAAMMYITHTLLSITWHPPWLVLSLLPFIIAAALGGLNGCISTRYYQQAVSLNAYQT